MTPEPRTIIEIIGHRVHHEIGTAPSQRNPGIWWDHWFCACGWQAWADARISTARMTAWHDADTRAHELEQHRRRCPRVDQLEQLARYVDDLHLEPEPGDPLRRCCHDHDARHNALVLIATHARILAKEKNHPCP